MTDDVSAHLEVLTMGRVGVDLYPEQVGVVLEDVTTFAQVPRRQPHQRRVAAARHGRSAAVITRTGDDPFGALHPPGAARLRRRRPVRDARCPTCPTPVTFCEIFPPDDFPLYFYRYPTAPDLQIRADELDLDAIAAADIFWVTGTGLSPGAVPLGHDGGPRGARLARHRPCSTSTTGRCSGRRPRRRTTTSAPRSTYADVAVGNREECEVAIGEREPEAAAAALLDAGVDLAIVKQGPAGVLGVRGDESVVVPPVPVDVVNGLGAGDAFGGALCHGLLAGWDLERMLRFANAAGAVVAGRMACADAMPTTDELEEILGRVS